MATVIRDRVQQATATAGTGPFALGTAQVGFVSFSAVMSVGDTCDYCAIDPITNDWEVGLGTYSAANTLTRTTVRASSNGGAAVNFAGNASTTVFLTASAQQLTNLSPGSRQITTSTDQTLSADDEYVLLNRTASPAAFNLTLPATQNKGRPIVILDVAGNCKTNPVTVLVASGTIDGAANFVINENYQTVEFLRVSATVWKVGRAYLPDFSSGATIHGLTDIGAALAATSELPVTDGTSDFKATMAEIAKVSRSIPTASDSQALPYAIQPADNDALVVLTGTTGNLSAGTLADGFGCWVLNKASGNATFSGIAELGGATTLAPNTLCRVYKRGSTVEARSFSGGGAATAYTRSLSASSGASGSPVTETLHPNGYWPTGATITLSNTGLTGAYSSPTNATLSGSTLTLLAGNGDVTVVFTPSAAATGTLNSTNNVGLTDAGGATYTATSGGSLLLDSLSSTVRAAYSVRKLRSAYAGPAIRVVVGGTTTDIGFTGNDLNVTALATAAGSGSAFIDTWYDQTGNGNHLLQTTSANRPRIVNAGVIDNFGDTNSRPAPLYDQNSSGPNGPSMMQIAGVTVGPACAVFAVASASSNAGFSRLVGFRGNGSADDAAAGSFLAAYLNGSTLAGYSGSDLSGAAFSFSSARHQVASVFTSTQHTMTLDGTAASSASWGGSVNEPVTITVGSRNDANLSCTWNGKIPEVVLVHGAVAAGDQATIRSSQQTYFGTS